MSRLWPTPAEAGTLRFLLPLPGLRARFLLAGAFFLLGVGIWVLSPWPRWLGLAVALAGHLPLWVKRQTTAPGGATPVHEEIWAPTEEEWFDRLAELEKKGKEWDASPWDVTSLRGCLGLLAVAAALVVGLVLAAGWLGDGAWRLAAAVVVLVVPLWFNGIRTTWNPSELRLKGEALAVAREVAERQGRGDFEPVPLLALREGRRGKYPVDAKLMLRPAAEDGSGFLGVQVQVALNNVRGTDYPYLYCVVLGKPGFRLPAGRGRHKRPERGLQYVFERGGGSDAEYLVVRRHADRGGGWHTRPKDVREIVEVAIEEGRKAWAENRREAEA